MNDVALRERTTEEHAHRWRIDEPAGPTSPATCKICGAIRLFRNWLSETDYLTSEERRGPHSDAA
jgi:hypothetical protein